MQATVTSRDENDESDELSVNDGDFSGDYLGNGDVRMANANDTEIPYILSASGSNGSSDFSIMSQRERVTYVADIARKAGFASLADVFIAQLCNFPSLKADGLHVVQSIMYKPELKRTQSLLRKDEKVHSYIAKYARDLVNKEMSSIRKFQPLRLESSYLSPQKILAFDPP